MEGNKMAKSIDSLLEKHDAKTCTMSPPQDIASWSNILRQLGTLYVGSAIEAFKEYITNAADAGAKNIEITIVKKGPNKKICVADDGKGMYLPSNEKALLSESSDVTQIDYSKADISQESILRLPKKVGDSAKKLDETVQGKKAIGALAWQTLSDKVAFISKQKGQLPVAWICSHSKKGQDHVYESQVIDRIDKDYPLAFEHGTEVMFEKLSADTLKELSASRLKRELGSKFRDLIKDKGVKIRIKDGDSTLDVIPEEYSGEKIKEIPSKVDTKYGPIFFELYVNPAEKSGVIHVKQGIQTLIEDLSKKRDLLESPAWGSGILQGQIRANWLEPAAGRQEAELDDKAKVFFEECRKYNNMLEKIVQENSNANDGEQKKSFYNILFRACKQLFKDHPEYADFLTGYKVSKKGEEVEGIPVDEQKRQPIITPREPVEEPGKVGPKKPSKPVDPEDDGGVKVKPTTAIRFDDRDLGQDVLSLFEQDMNTIVFNHAHPCYIQAMRDPAKKKLYLTGLVGKEILSKAYKDRELTDQVIIFQQRLLGYSF
jgi:hypothetical protein